MTLLHSSSLVFVGKFPEDIFDERELFDGRLDPGGRMRVGPVMQCSYAGGMYQFRITPDRIDLVANSSDIVPDTLVNAARFISEELESARRAVQISGFGMNSETIFDRNLVGKSGLSYCLNLAASQIATLIDSEPANSLTRVQFVREPIRYEVRIEPHFQSNGENLFVAVNGHQEVNIKDSLDAKFQHIDAFRHYVEEFHRRIVKTEGSA